MCVMSEERIQAGVEALRRGDHRRARRLFSQVVNAEPDNVAAWWFLAAVLDVPEQKAECLRRVLLLRPDHAEARRLLSQLEGHLLSQPPEGPPEVLDAEEAGDGVMVTPPSMRRPDLPEAPDPTGTQDAAQPASDTRVVTAAVLVSLLAIIVTVVLVWTGAFPGLPGVRGMEEQPTAIPLAFGVEACAVSVDGRTTLVFINNSPVEVEILRGLAGQETVQMTLAPGEQGLLEARPDLRIRYAVHPVDAAYRGSGAFFEISRGSTCRIPIQ